jgi:hypothetical protein
MKSCRNQSHVDDLSFDLFSLDKKYGKSKSWFFFCEDDTVLDLNGILEILNKYDHTKVKVT